MRLHYTVPKTLVAVGNGQLEKREESGDRASFHWFVSYPINTYNVTLYVGNFQLLEDAYTGINGQQLALNHYVLPENFQKAKTHFKQLHAILKVFERRFGEYPWYRDGFRLVESPYAGMEHQTAIAYGNGYKNDLDEDTDYILLHETAHEWWGNSITAKDLADVWIQEGFATYAEALYMEAMGGEIAYQEHLFLNRIFIKNKYPVVGVKDRRWFHHKKSSDAYVKGSWILHSLRNQIEDDTLFFDIIKSFYQTYQYQLVASQDFIELVNGKTGKDYGWFFQQYLYQRQAPELAWYLSKDGIFYYQWTNVIPEFDQFKVELRVLNAWIPLTPSNELQKVEIPMDADGFVETEVRADGLVALKEDKGLTKK